MKLRFHEKACGAEGNETPRRGVRYEESRHFAALATAKQLQALPMSGDPQGRHATCYHAELVADLQLGVHRQGHGLRRHAGVQVYEHEARPARWHSNRRVQSASPQRCAAGVSRLWPGMSPIEQAAAAK